MRKYTKRTKEYVRTPEIKEKIRQSLLGNVPWNKGKNRPPFSKEWKEKLRISHLGNKSHTGEKHDEAYKIRMSKATKGIPKSEEMKTRVKIALTGKPKTEEHKQKTRGSNHWNWNPDREQIMKNSGGRRNTEHRNWSNSVKERDGKKCKISDEFCSGKIQAHHIKPFAMYKELRYIISNGITLCTFHHPTTRRDEKRLEKFFQKLIK